MRCPLNFSFFLKSEFDVPFKVKAGQIGKYLTFCMNYYYSFVFYFFALLKLRNGVKLDQKCEKFLSYISAYRVLNLIHITYK